MAEFTPTTEQVEDGYAHDPEAEWRDPVNYGSDVAANRRAFRRWLEAHDRQVAVKAIRDAADEMAYHYPEDIFTPLNSADHDMVNAALKEHTEVSRDAVSADMMRRAAAQLRARANDLEQGN